MSQALYRKWRPKTWDDVLGQEHIIQTLRNAVASGRVAHAYLFSGPRGTGKTTTARLLAKAVNCLHEDVTARPCNQCQHCQAVNENRFLDLIEIDAASNNGVDDVRELRDKINFAPSQGKYKIYIIDEVHMLSTPAFNALLKTLEEPPPYAIFILATTEIHKIPATVLSRCQRHEFRRLPMPVILERLQTICQAEGIEAEPQALALIARHSAGGMRDAISLLDQMAAASDQITLAQVQTVLGASADETVLMVVDAVLDGTPGAGLRAIHEAVNQGSDPRALARQIVSYLRDVLLLKMDVSVPLDVSDEIKKTMRMHAERFHTRRLIEMIRAFNQAANEARAGWQPSLGLELALAESLPAAAGVEIVSARQDAPVRDAAPVQDAAPPPSPSPAEPADVPAEPALQSGERLTLSVVQRVWEQVKATVRKEDAVLNGLLNTASLFEIKDDTLVLSFSSAVLQQKASEDARIALTERALERLLGRKVRVRFIVAEKHAGQQSGSMVAAALKQGGKLAK